MKKRAVVVAGVFCVVVLAISVLLAAKNAGDQMDILEESIESQLLSVSVAARQIITEDQYHFADWNSIEDVEADLDSYVRLREQLRDLVQETDVEYIYALKLIDGEYQFVLDSDPEDEEVFIPYEAAPVHLEAFTGAPATGVMNVQDEYGTFNTGAVPIVQDGKVLGIVSVDISDAQLQQSISATRRNMIVLVAALLVAILLMFVFIGALMKRLETAQQKLRQMAHYDAVTGLPNRQYLLETLQSISGDDQHAAYALFFIDMDNFKAVNDNAGHDAGDDLLRYVGEFLQNQFKDSTAFRPSAGVLNVSARIGGDEFVQIVPGVKTEEEAGKLADGLIQRFTSENHNRYIDKYKVGMSVGVALFPYHTDNFHVLIKYADIAMYHAKNAGKNTWRIYSDEMEAKDEK